MKRLPVFFNSHYALYFSYYTPYYGPIEWGWNGGKMDAPDIGCIQTIIHPSIIAIGGQRL